MSQTDAWMPQAVGGAVTGTLVMSTVGFLEIGLARPMPPIPHRALSIFWGHQFR
jgi:hypothetical protein